MKTYFSTRSLATAARIDRGQVTRLTARRVITPAAMLVAGAVGRPPILLFGTGAVEIVRDHFAATQPVKIA
jgi:hypothetical protein